MSVRKRKWSTKKGERREAWIVDYSDQDGERHIKTFDRKKDADAYHAEVSVGVKAGTHIAPSKSVTVSDAGKSWILGCRNLEPATVEGYQSHLDLHILPFIGGLRLSDVTPQVVRGLEDTLRAHGRSNNTTRKVLTSLGSLLGDAQERGLAARNAVRELRRNRRPGKDARVEERKKTKLKAGVDIPLPEEIRRIVANAKPSYRSILVAAAFTGLRASELRGLLWEDVDLKKCEIHVRQRADKFGQIGNPKSAAAHRAVPFGPVVANTLREWKLVCPKGPLGLVFPNRAGNVENIGNIAKRGFHAAQIAAGITVQGGPKYTGLHCLRHFYAWWCINAIDHGGLGLPPKVVQERLGHSSITLTYDCYGHLFPREDDAARLELAEKVVLG
jgi:integrase